MSKSALLSARRNDASTQASGRKDPIIRAELLKTVLCRQWESGSCKFGARCHFAHGKADICDKRVPSNTPASIIQSRPDTHQDAAPIVRGLPQEKRENPHSYAAPAAGPLQFRRALWTLVKSPSWTMESCTFMTHRIQKETRKRYSQLQLLSEPRSSG